MPTELITGLEMPFAKTDADDLPVLMPAPKEDSTLLSSLLTAKKLVPVFQPLASMQDGSVYAHEALIRGPVGTPLHMPDSLFAAANAQGLLFELEVACVVAAIDRWSEMRQPGRLFLNLSASALLEMLRQHSIESVLAAVKHRGLLPRMLVIEITEHERVHDVKGLCEAVSELHTAGVMFALDDFGDGSSSLRLWSELQPDIVKIDKYFIADLSRHAKKALTLRALIQIAEVFGTTLVAEGIETSEELRIVRDLGISLGQGYFLGRPGTAPVEAVAVAASKVLQDQRVSVMPTQRTAEVSGRLRELQTINAPAITPAATHDDVEELFDAHPGLHAVAILDGETPIALLDRRQFRERSAKRFFKELYGTRSCMTFANTAPRLIEREHSAGDLIGILTSQDQRYLTEGFIVTANGRYVGLGTGDQLVRTVTESRIEAARHANPLTFLPGNIPITEHIERLLASRGEFVACYADLNNFKPFNDHYGYWRGDEMIRLMASVAVARCDAQRDFVGHVGGDDFILLFQSDDWERRCEEIVSAFNEGARHLYDDAQVSAGGIEAEDRHGVMRFFSFTTVSVGAVRVRKGQFRSAEAVANAAAAVKHSAKLANVGLYVASDADQSGSNSAAVDLHLAVSQRS